MVHIAACPLHLSHMSSLSFVRSGLAIARNERLEDELGTSEITRVWITGAGELVRAAEF